MAKGPAVVVIARHGARLDAADKTWHLTSPTPYDPPLTYGGWTQAKALGLRIAALLHERENEVQPFAHVNGNRAAASNADLANLEFSPLDGHRNGPDVKTNGLPSKKRKHKVVIHSSPYLRCVQTSTGIAAGLSQFQAPPASTNLKGSESFKGRNGLHAPSPLSRISPLGSPSAQEIAVVDPIADPNLEVFPKNHIGPEKILLRIDAFLGEWLSPDYFEDITPPPNSTMMVAGAKADLLRRGEYVEAQPSAQGSQGHFPGGWAKSAGPSVAPSRKNTGDGSFPTLGSLAQALPLRERSSSQSMFGGHIARTNSRGVPLATTHKVPDHIYDPPVPSYAVSPSDPIPKGYTAHARDACLDVDFQWDSMRPPQEWGDGGEYGDEWSTMHKRFRKGLAGMMAWYKEHGVEMSKDKYPGFIYNPTHAPVAVSESASDPGPVADASVEEDEDLVLILVTHGAGCNALLGAISNQPVLMDVSQASLSMAVRRDEPRKPSITSPPAARRPSIVDVGMSNEYEMKLLASIDHLRSGTDPSKPPQQQQPQSPAVSSPSAEYRRRFTTASGNNTPVDGPFTIGEPFRHVNSSLGSMRRSSSSGSSSRYLSSNMGGSVSPSTGLWGGMRGGSASPLIGANEGRTSPGHDMVLNFREHKPSTSSTVTSVTSLSPSSQPADIALKANTATTKVASSPLANGLTRITTTERKEENDDVPPLPSGLGGGLALGRSGSQSSGGLWSAKPRTGSVGLWGPPRLDSDEVGERFHGPKRRWTVSERE